MRCFELFANDRRVARAGVASSGIVTASFSIISAGPADSALYDADEEGAQALLIGMESPTPGMAGGRRLVWTDEPFRVGDKFRLVVVESATRDEPARVEDLGSALNQDFAGIAEKYLRALIPLVGAALRAAPSFAPTTAGGSIEQLREAIRLGPIPTSLRDEIVSWALGKLLEAGVVEAVDTRFRLASKSAT